MEQNAPTVSEIAVLSLRRLTQPHRVDADNRCWRSAALAGMDGHVSIRHGIAIPNPDEVPRWLGVAPCCRTGFRQCVAPRRRKTHGVKCRNHGAASGSLAQFQRQRCVATLTSGGPGLINRRAITQISVARTSVVSSVKKQPAYHAGVKCMGSSMLDPDREDGEPLPTKDSENLDKAFGPDGHFVSCGGLINRAAGWGDG